MVCDVNDKAIPPTETTAFMSNVSWKKLRKLVKTGLESGASVSIYWPDNGGCSVMMTPPEKPSVTEISSPTWPITTPVYYTTDHQIREDDIKVTCDANVTNQTTSINQESIVRDIMVGNTTEV